MAFFCIGPCVRPFEEFNKWAAKGTSPDLLAALPGLGETPKFIETGMDLKHYQDDWLGTDAWFGPASGAKLHKAFIYALHAAGDRPVSAVWVEGVGVRASVVDHGDAIQVVVSSPRPHVPSESPCANGPCGTVFPIHGRDGTNHC